jgi:50S ribosomal protein L16 3-hydroxylase
MLCRRDKFFINGEIFTGSVEACRLLTELADNYELTSTGNIDKATGEILYQWYLNGYVKQKI